MGSSSSRTPPVREVDHERLVGGLSAIVGSYVVLRSMAFLGDAIAHSVLPGVAVGFLVSGRGDRRALFWWALLTAILVSLGVGWTSRQGRIKEETAIGIVFAGMFSLGIALMSTVRGFAVDPLLQGVPDRLVRPDARHDPPPPGRLLPVPPPHPDRDNGRRLPPDGRARPDARDADHAGYDRVSPRQEAAGDEILSGIIGLYLSFYFGIASGAAIVLVAIGFFLIVLLVSPRRGFIRRILRSAKEGG